MYSLQLLLLILNSRVNRQCVFLKPWELTRRTLFVSFLALSLRGHTIRLHHIAAALDMALLKECDPYVPCLL